MYDTSGQVNIIWCTLTNNTLSPLDAKASGNDNETSGGGIYIEFTNCPPGVASCDSNENIFFKYIINYHVFEGSAAIFGYKNHEQKYFHNENYNNWYWGWNISVV